MRQQPHRRLKSRSIRAACLALGFAGATPAVLAGGSTNFPGTETLLNAKRDDANWILPAKTYAGNRYTALRQIDKTNAGSLRVAWKTSIADNGEQEAAPIVWNGVMYLSTPHDGVLALDASTGKLLWQTPYNPAWCLCLPQSGRSPPDSVLQAMSGPQR